MADEIKENPANDSSTPVKTCLHWDAKTKKRCEKARAAGKMYCEGHKFEGGGGGTICYISRDSPEDDKEKIM